MPDSPVPADNRERRPLMERLWLELEGTRPGSKQHKALTKRIRQETDAFRAAFDNDDPTNVLASRERAARDD